MSSRSENERPFLCRDVAVFCDVSFSIVLKWNGALSVSLNGNDFKVFHVLRPNVPTTFFLRPSALTSQRPRAYM